MDLREGYISAALQLLELAKKEAVPVVEAGARNSRSDLALLQSIHDGATALGANCGAEEMSESQQQKEEARTAESQSTKAGGVETASLKVFESAIGTEEMQVQEAARADYEIKLISPGKGAMAFYPAEMLRRDGPKAFPSETKVYANHPPLSSKEGAGNRDVYRLAGVTTTPAEYKESHAKGPGLYARVKVFADHSTLFQEKGKYLGMSVIANGKQAIENGRLATKEGLPVMGVMTSGESVDVVSVAGAGGMIVQEAAIGSPQIQTQEVSVTEAEAKVLIESAVASATAPLRERAIREDARDQATRLLAGITLPQLAKTRIIESSLGKLPMKDGALDSTKFSEVVVAEAKSEGEYLAALGGGQRITGMGIAPAAPAAKPEEIAAREAARVAEETDMVAVYESMGMPHNAAVHAAKGRAA